MADCQKLIKKVLYIKSECFHRDSMELFAERVSKSFKSKQTNICFMPMVHFFSGVRSKQ